MSPNPITNQPLACNLRETTHSFSSCSLSASRVLDLGSEETTGRDSLQSMFAADHATSSLNVSPSNRFDSI